MSVKSPIKYHGGKSYLAPKIVELLPDRSTWHLWREPFFGGGSVTLALDPKGLSEAVNDLDGELMNFWYTLQSDAHFQELSNVLLVTPFSESTFHRSVDSMNTVNRSAAFFVRARQSRQGLGKDFATPTTRIRRGMNENVSAWLSAIDGLPDVHERLKRIEIRNMDAVKFIKKYDHERAVFYCDPPYLPETRHNGGGEYRHEMTREQHAELLACLSGIKGRFLLSGYPSPMYTSHAKNESWRCVEISIDNKASSKKNKEIKTECIWMNY